MTLSIVDILTLRPLPSLSAAVPQSKAARSGLCFWIQVGLALTVLYCGGLVPSVLQAQTAHQNYIQRTLASGLNGEGIAVDSSGNLYICAGNVVKKETLSGGSYTESTIGSGLFGAIGIAVDGSGNVYIADYGNGRALKETLSGGSYTQSTIASGLDAPEGVAVDSHGNVYIADTANRQVLKETLSGGSTPRPSSSMWNELVAQPPIQWTKVCPLASARIPRSTSG